MDVRRFSRRDLLGAAAATGALTLAGRRASAQPAGSYPNRPVRIVVPHPAGDTTDSMARALGEKLTAAWGQPVIVDNKVGAGGMIAAEAVAKAPPDGYTLLLTISSVVQNAILYPKVPYDLFKDFAPVARVANTPLAYIVRADSPYRSVADFVSAAKARPGELSYASYGLGTTAHIYYEVLADATKARIVHVPYKGGGPIMTDVIGGQVTSGLLSLTVALPQHRANRIRILAICSGRRFDGLPDVPTFAEAGYPDMSTAGWVGLLAPGGTPKEIVDRLSADLGTAARVPEIVARFEASAIEIASSSADQFAAQIRNDHRKWSELIRAFQIRIA